MWNNVMEKRLQETCGFKEVMVNMMWERSWKSVGFLSV